jgi:hypothetical protein
MIQETSRWWKNKWIQNTLLIGVGILGVYGIIYWDLTSRAKEAFSQAEKYMQWAKNPNEKTAYFEQRFLDEKAKLDKKLASQKITQDEYNEELSILEFDKEFALEESALKYAYQWYKDCYELFSPPESRWVKMARRKAPEALELWKDELREKKIPFEDYMFE